MRGQSQGWARSVDRGTCRRDIELRNKWIRNADVVHRDGRPYRWKRQRELFKGLRAVRDPKHAWKLHAREPGDPSNARHDFVSGPVGEGHEPEVQHARCWGVGRSYSTDKVPEQKRETVSG